MTYQFEELDNAKNAIHSLISKCDKVLPKLKPGTSQHTLLVRRIAALRIAEDLIQQKLGADSKDMNSPPE